MSSPPHFPQQLLNSQGITAGAPPRQSRASSAFSRLANIAALSAGTTTTTTSTASAAAPSASAPTVAASAPTAADLVHQPPPSAGSRGGALDALETIVHADHDRWRSKSTGPPPPSTAAAATVTAASNGTRDDRLASTGSQSTANRYEPRARTAGSRTGWRARDLSESRSRERRPPLTFGDVSGSGFSGLGGVGAGGGGTSYLGSVSESPSSMSFRTGWTGSGGGILGNSVGGPGGGEQLPPNASYSAFSSFAGLAAGVDSHFFPHGSSAFSFEAGGSVSNSPWDSSYRSSLAGSPSPFNYDSRSSSVPRQPSGLPSPLQPRSDPTAATTSGGGNLHSSLAAGGNGAQGLDSARSSPPTRSPASVPTSFARTSSPIGGGRKPKDSSRGLRYTVATPARDKGLVGLAKPPKDAEQGRVAVAGKTSLKILRVPYGTRRKREPSPQPPPSRDDSDTETLSRRARAVEAVQAAFPASSIAARRSRSRGSPAPQSNPGGGGHNGAPYSSSIRDGSTPRFGLEDELAEREIVTEVLDVRIGSKLGPTYLFSDVRWGYGATSNKIATSFSNGAVVLWDLAKEGNRIDQLKYEHDRAVNRVVFGGQTGNWLMSGGQDGQMKLWDIRESRPASMILKASSPIRHLSFSPSASQPFTLLAACASGTMIRYDVRYVSRQNGGATDRIAGHVGACLAMDWRDGFACEKFSNGGGETAGGGREGGWVVTGGVDRTIKVWDFSLPTLSTKPVRTLYTSQPVHSLAWHPTRPTELVSSPMQSLGLGTEGSSSAFGDEVPSTPITTSDSAMAAMIKGESPAARSRTDRYAWKNEIEVWDVRRPYFPKFAIKTDEPVSGLLYNDDETLWTTSRGFPTFQQFDIASDSYSLLDSIDRPGSTWNIEGDFAFLDNGRARLDVPFDRTHGSMAVPVDSVKFRPDAYVNTVPQFDPDFSFEVFAFLADNLRLSGPISEVCDHNAAISRQAGRSDASQLWSTLKAWLDNDPDPAPAVASPPESVPEASDPLLVSREGRQLTAEAARTLSPPISEVAASTRRLSDSSSRSRPSRRTSVTGTPRQSRTSGQPTPAQATSRSRLDSFAEESTASESESPDPVNLFPELSATSSDSDEDGNGRLERIREFNAKRLAASLSALDGNADEAERRTPSSSRRKFSTSSGLLAPETMRDDAVGESALSSSSSGSDLEDEENADGPVMHDASRGRRSRSARIASMHASLIANRSRRPSAGQPQDQSVPRVSRLAEDTLPRSASRQRAQEPKRAVPHNGARTTSSVGSQRTASVEARRRASVQKRLPPQEVPVTAASLKLAIGREHATQLRELLQHRIKTVLVEYADQGDSQLCATIACVVGSSLVLPDAVWVARTTKTYTDLLRRLDLHVAAARITKACQVHSLRAQTQDTVVFHTSCGTCGRANDRSPYGDCSKCHALAVKCCVCHLAVESLYLFCVGCGHGAHLACLRAAAATTASHSTSAPQTPIHPSQPSTPGIGTPMQTWLWGEATALSSVVTASSATISAHPAATTTEIDPTAGDHVRRPDAASASMSCPASCGHTPCQLQDFLHS